MYTHHTYQDYASSPPQIYHSIEEEATTIILGVMHHNSSKQLPTVIGESSEVAGDPVSWKHRNTSSASTQLFSELAGGGATIWPNMRSGVVRRRTSFLSGGT